MEVLLVVAESDKCIVMSQELKKDQMCHGAGFLEVHLICRLGYFTRTGLLLFKKARENSKQNTLTRRACRKNRDWNKRKTRGCRI